MNFNCDKIVNKPWGREVWISLGENYCFKIIEIKKGYKTSLQYHEKKQETNYINKGRALLTIKENEKNVKQVVMEEGMKIDISPSTIHRFEALEDLIMYEVSTPEVGDVIRLKDDYGREGTSEF